MKEWEREDQRTETNKKERAKERWSRVRRTKNKIRVSDAIAKRCTDCCTRKNNFAPWVIFKINKNKSIKLSSPQVSWLHPCFLPLNQNLSYPPFTTFIMSAGGDCYHCTLYCTLHFVALKISWPFSLILNLIVIQHSIPANSSFLHPKRGKGKKKAKKNGSEQMERLKHVQLWWRHYEYFQVRLKREKVY